MIPTQRPAQHASATQRAAPGPRGRPHQQDPRHRRRQAPLPPPRRTRRTGLRAHQTHPPDHPLQPPRTHSRPRRMAADRRHPQPAQTLPLYAPLRLATRTRGHGHAAQRHSNRARSPPRDRQLPLNASQPTPLTPTAHRQSPQPLRNSLYTTLSGHTPLRIRPASIDACRSPVSACGRSVRSKARASFHAVTRRRAAFGILPLAAIYTLIALGEGLWLLAIPGVIMIVIQVVVVLRRPRPRPKPSPPPAERPTPPPAAPSTPLSPPTVRTARRTSPRDRAAARRPGRRGRGRPGA